jgi:hypothetical protein
MALRGGCGSVVEHVQDLGFDPQYQNKETNKTQLKK